MQADSDTATYNLSKYSAENPSSAGTSGSPSTDSKYKRLLKAQEIATAELANIKNDYTNAQTEMTNKKTAYDTATATRKTAEMNLSTNDKAITSTYRALLDQADTAQTNSRTTYEAEQVRRMPWQNSRLPTRRLRLILSRISVSIRRRSRLMKSCRRYGESHHSGKCS